MARIRLARTHVRALQQHNSCIKLAACTTHSAARSTTCGAPSQKVTLKRRITKQEIQKGLGWRGFMAEKGRPSPSRRMAATSIAAQAPLGGAVSRGPPAWPADAAAI